ncbi:uroporphyrinogen decarboxylase family protein [Candidatus Latescibacterota bacterium]
MTSRERIQLIMQHDQPDRVGIYDHYWTETLQRWQNEGMPVDVSAEDYFEHDIMFSCESAYDESLCLEEKVFSKDNEKTIRLNSYGVMEEVWSNADRAGVARAIDVTIKNLQDWDKYSNRLTPSLERMDHTYSERYKRARNKQKYLILSLRCPWNLAWRMHGFENTLMDMALSPDFIERMFSDIMDFQIGMISLLFDEGYEYDCIELRVDCASKNGLLFSEKHYRDLLLPHHKRLCDFASENNLPLIFDNDGNINALLPDHLKTGVRGLFPLEVKAGMDVRNLKTEYPEFVLCGNIDARVMSRSHAEIEEEIAGKITVAKEGGGYIYHVDHSVPPDVSLENYLFVLETVKRYGDYSQ